LCLLICKQLKNTNNLPDSGLLGLFASAYAGYWLKSPFMIT
jgi:hypothetical protein